MYLFRSFIVILALALLTNNCLGQTDSTATSPPDNLAEARVKFREGSVALKAANDWEVSREPSSFAKAINQYQIGFDAYEASFALHANCITACMLSFISYKLGKTDKAIFYCKFAESSSGDFASAHPDYFNEVEDIWHREDPSHQFNAMRSDNSPSSSTGGGVLTITMTSLGGSDTSNVKIKVPKDAAF